MHEIVQFDRVVAGFIRMGDRRTLKSAVALWAELPGMNARANLMVSLFAKPRWVNLAVGWVGLAENRKGEGILAFQQALKDCGYHVGVTVNERVVAAIAEEHQTTELPPHEFEAMLDACVELKEVLLRKASNKINLDTAHNFSLKYAWVATFELSAEQRGDPRAILTAAVGLLDEFWLSSGDDLAAIRRIQKEFGG
jgi:hypothetical protein